MWGGSAEKRGCWQIYSIGSHKALCQPEHSEVSRIVALLVVSSHIFRRAHDDKKEQSLAAHYDRTFPFLSKNYDVEMLFYILAQKPKNAFFVCF